MQIWTHFLAPMPALSILFLQSSNRLNQIWRVASLYPETGHIQVYHKIVFCSFSYNTIIFIAQDLWCESFFRFVSIIFFLPAKVPVPSRNCIMRTPPWFMLSFIMLNMNLLSVTNSSYLPINRNTTNSCLRTSFIGKKR